MRRLLRFSRDFEPILLAVHVLNVGKGDSIVLEYRADGQGTFAVIDSNCPVGQTPAALRKLQELGAPSLSFVALTHPHTDHFTGLDAILSAFQGRIDSLYTYPIDKDRERLKNLAMLYKRQIDGTDNVTIKAQSLEFIKILEHARGIDNWITPTGTLARMAVDGFGDVEIYTILPPASIRGDKFYQLMSSGKELPDDFKVNELSLAFLILYRGHSIILGGDGTHDRWVAEQKQLRKIKRSFDPIATKIPHHGSKHDCTDTVIGILYESSTITENAPVACISADGRVNHPHPDVIDNLVSRNIKPYCTNLARRCGGQQSTQQLDPRSLAPELVRYVSSVAIPSGAIAPCQGDVTIVIDDAGQFTTSAQHRHLCPYRGDYAFLSSVVQ